MRSCAPPEYGITARRLTSSVQFARSCDSFDKRISPSVTFARTALRISYRNCYDFRHFGPAVPRPQHSPSRPNGPTDRLFPRRIQRRDWRLAGNLTLCRLADPSAAPVIQRATTTSFGKSAHFSASNSVLFPQALTLAVQLITQGLQNMRLRLPALFFRRQRKRIIWRCGGQQFQFIDERFSATEIRTTT